MAALGTVRPGAKNISGALAGPLFFTVSIFFLTCGPLLSPISAGPGAMSPRPLLKPPLSQAFLQKVD